MANEAFAEISDRLAEALRKGITDGSFAPIMKRVEDIRNDIESDIQYRIKESLADDLAVYVCEMADKAVGALLAGNERQMRSYLQCREGWWNGRSDSDHFSRGIAEKHPVIHGILFEQGAIALRASIASAHRDLIASERILDLEDQVKSLVAQVNAARNEIDCLHERLRSGA